MQVVKVKLGDTAWYHNGKEDMSSGKVVHVFELWNKTHYIIAVETHIEPVLHVRDFLTVSDDKDKPIGMWRNMNFGVINNSEIKPA